MKGRSIAAAFAGIIAGLAVGYILGPLVWKTYPMDKEVIESLAGNRKALAELYRNQPTGFHLSQIGIGVLRLLLGMFVASLIDRKNLMTPIVVAAFCLLITLLDVFAWPNPFWFGFVYIPLVIGAAFGYVYWRRKSS